MSGRPRRERGIGLVAALLVALGIGVPSARAQGIMFDPDGSGPVAPSSNVSTLNFSAGNALAFNFFTGGPTFTVFFQARLGNIADEDGNLLDFLPNTQELTVVTGFRETITTPAPAPPAQATEIGFATSVDQTAGGTFAPFIEIYYDTVANSNALSGTGFDDGTLILSARPLAGDTGNFSVNVGASFPPPTGTPPRFDQAGANNFTLPTPINTTRTVVGQGATTLSGDVTFLNTAFFPGGLAQIDVIDLDTTTTTPFTDVNPSYRFDGLPGTQPNQSHANLNYAGGLPAGTTPYQLGNVNGIFQAGAVNQSFQFQARGGASFNPSPIVVVPEPGTISLALTGTGLVSLATLRARRRRAG